MKRIDYTMKVKQVGSDDSTAWNEDTHEMVEESVSNEEHAKSIIKYFNDTLKPYEKARELVSVTDLNDTGSPVNHVWNKVSLVTETGGFDRMECENCGCTGKRFGLRSFVQIDPKYRKHEYNCPNKKVS